MSLSWDDPGDDSITGYLVLRRCRVLHETGEFMLHVEDRVSESPEYVVPSVRYVYRIKAWNVGGLSERSEWFDADMPAAPPGPNNPATGAPTIRGTARVGETLTAGTSGIADPDGLTDVTYSYRWVANDGTADTDISGATGSTYTLVSADEGRTLRVRVSFTDDGGYSETLTSTATDAVAAGAPTDPPPDEGEDTPAPAISVSYAEVQEGPGAVLAFGVTLDRASTSEVTVDWETRDSSAQAGTDYLEGTGTLRFAPGETAKTVNVVVLVDADDEEGREVMILRVLNATGSTIARDIGAGLILP